MSDLRKSNVCLRCGEKLKFKNDEYGITLKHIMGAKTEIGPISENERTDYLISFFMKRTNKSTELVTEYVTHRMNRCILKERDCPECRNTLKTWRAKLCLECGAEFEPLDPYK